MGHLRAQSYRAVTRPTSIRRDPEDRPHDALRRWSDELTGILGATRRVTDPRPPEPVDQHTRTLERWEQGRSKPNEQAAALIWLVLKYPDTFDRLESLGVPA
jgi:hypothetical protein